MQVVECCGHIRSSYLRQNDTATWVSIYEVCHIVDFVVNDNPEVLLIVVLSYFISTVGLGRHCEGRRKEKASDCQLR